MENLIQPPKSWKNQKEHFMTIIDNEWYHILAKLQNTLTIATYDFYSKRGYSTLHLPITTGSISSPMGRGSDSSPVKINLFGIETYLADSMQFMLEYGCRLNPRGCYYLMPSFRGEKADERHLCQFYHSEVEIEGRLDDVMALGEEYIRYLCERFIKECSEDIKKVTRDLSHIEILLKMNKIPRITTDEAIELLEKKYPNMDLYQKDEEYHFRNINKLGEKMLMDYFGGFVWLTNFDHLAVPFYQAFDETGTHAKNADLLFGIGEVIGSGERHVGGEEVHKALELHEVDVKDYEWYITMREQRPLHTSGFGMGTERFLMWLLKTNDIRDYQLLPRFNGVICNP